MTGIPNKLWHVNPYTAMAWLGTLLVGAGYLFFLQEGAGRRQFAVPLMFWTFFGVLVIVATASAIALPGPRAAFWRGLVLALLALTRHDNSQTAVFDTILSVLPATIRKMISSQWNGEPHWVWLIAAGLTYLLISLTAASVASAMARRNVGTANDRFQFRLLHVFLLSAVVACTLTALRADNAISLRATILVSAATRLCAGVLAAAGRRQAVFCWGFLAGDLTWSLLVVYHGIALEWDGLLPPNFGVNRRDPMLRLLLPLYAGLMTGILTAMLYRPEQITEKPRD